MYGVPAHLCSAGLDKTSVLDPSFERKRRRKKKKAARQILVQCSNEMKWKRLLTKFVLGQMTRRRLPLATDASEHQANEDDRIRPGASG